MDSEYEILLDSIDSYSDRTLIHFCRDHHIPLPIYPTRKQLMVSVSSFLKNLSLQRSRAQTPIINARNQFSRNGYYSPRYSFMSNEKQQNSKKTFHLTPIKSINTTPKILNSSIRNKTPSTNHASSPVSNSIPTVSPIILELAKQHERPVKRKKTCLFIVYLLLFVCIMTFIIYLMIYINSEHPSVFHNFYEAILRLKKKLKSDSN